MSYLQRLNDFKRQHEEDTYWVFEADKYNSIPETMRHKMLRTCGFKDFRIIGNEMNYNMDYVILIFHGIAFKKMAEVSFPEILKFIKKC